MNEIIPRKAFVLAAGLGTRLKELTQNTPKCLIEVGNKPILFYQLEKLKNFGITQVCINLHHKAEQVRDSLSRAGNLGLEIAFSCEEELLDTGGALKHARWFFDENESFLLVNADILTGMNYGELSKTANRDSLAVLATRQSDESRRLVLDNQKHFKDVGEFVVPYPENSIAFTGVSLYSPKIMRYVMDEPRDIFSIKDIWKKVVQGGDNILTYEIPKQCSWFDIGTKESLAEARNHFANYGEFQ